MQSSRKCADKSGMAAVVTKLIDALAADLSSEELRLEALRDLRLLDTPAEREFDELARIAAQICNAPMASITLVDANRLWFKAKYGFEGTEAPRAGSLCDSAIEQTELFVVPDTFADPRFSKSPFVVATQVRFYAATQLQASSGYNLGTLCVLDMKTRELTPEQTSSLQALGRQVVAQMEMRRTIADLRASQVELEKFSHEALQARDAKSTFLANMSHEIRTPMNGIIGMTDLLLDSELSVEQRQQLTILKNSGGTLLQIINDILDFSKIEAHKIDLERVHFAPRAVVEESVALYGNLASGKGLSLVSESTIPDTLAVRADMHRFKQILNNLVCNALKFTSHGQITVTSELVPTAGEALQLKVSVRDTGMGISPENCAKLFQNFAQADSSVARQFGGTGLGLSISQSLSRLMGGEIRVTSELEKGSTFSFSILVEPAEALVATVPRVNSVLRPAETPLRVLVAEDNSTNQIVIKSMLRRLGCEVEIVENGLAAFEILRTQVFDLVLMDGHMPVLNGYEATERIIAEIPASRRPPIIALTASARVEDRARCLAIGMSDYLAKPIKAEALREIIERHAPASRSECRLSGRAA